MSNRLIFIVTYIDNFNQKHVKLVEGITVNSINNQLINKQVLSLVQVV